MVIFYIFFFILGTVIGSFLNVVILRLKNKKSIFKKPSHCPFCKEKLKWYELIPIISFVLQKGRCRKCKKKISWQYPLVELATGLLFFLIIFNWATTTHTYQFSIFSVFLLLISCFLIIIFVYDLKYYLVPDKIIYPAIVITLLYGIQSSRFANAGAIFNLQSIFNYLLAGAIGGTFFLVIFLISRGKWMGLGDVKIGVLMGLLLGLSHLFIALFLAFLIGGTVSIILLVLKKKALKSEIPLGPFLTGATFITLLCGDFDFLKKENKFLYQFLLKYHLPLYREGLPDMYKYYSYHRK
ncbi:Type 4 prepilin-like proteins leader peptide-processing enzyme [subsurface metagenome]